MIAAADIDGFILEACSIIRREMAKLIKICMEELSDKNNLKHGLLRIYCYILVIMHLVKKDLLYESIMQQFITTMKLWN